MSQQEIQGLPKEGQAGPPLYPRDWQLPGLKRRRTEPELSQERRAPSDPPDRSWGLPQETEAHLGVQVEGGRPHPECIYYPPSFICCFYCSQLISAKKKTLCNEQVKDSKKNLSRINPMVIWTIAMRTWSKERQQEPVEMQSRSRERGQWMENNQEDIKIWERCLIWPNMRLAKDRPGWQTSLETWRRRRVLIRYWNLKVGGSG
jgi:hypothetical protein